MDLIGVSEEANSENAGGRNPQATRGCTVSQIKEGHVFECNEQDNVGKDYHLGKWNFRMARAERKISNPEKGRWGAVVIKPEPDAEALWPPPRQRGSWAIHSIVWDK